MPATITHSSLPDLVTRNLDLFACPKCSSSLEVRDDGLACTSCRQHFGQDSGIPLLFWPNDWEESKGDVTETVKKFYEQTPFPNYDRLDSAASLREKACKGIFARLLDEQIRPGATVLEAGCGTGQLSNFLGMTTDRRVFGSDICLNSMKLASKFKNENQIDEVAFVQMNLFKPIFKPASFDVVISNGVLHHTSDPFGGFQSIARLVKPGGHILIGLYNTYGRLTTDFRRVLFRIFGRRFSFFDDHLSNNKVEDQRKHAWYMDQYEHPHESKHTLGEVLNWFDQTGFEFISSIPKSTAFDPFTEDEKLFEPHPKGSAFDHFMVQSGMLMTGGRDGALFIMIGRKKAN